MTETILSRNATTNDTIFVPVSQLGISISHLVRPLDEQYIRELAQTDENVWEPIEIRVWPERWQKADSLVEYHVVSGNHRTSAARIKNLSTIRARIIEASDDLSYLLAAIRTNAQHGRNFTEDDRRVLAVKLKKHGQSADQIAALFHVNRATVYNWINGRDSNASKKKAASERTKDALANLGIQGLDDDWKYIPAISVDAKRLAKTGQMINDFLAETPTTEDKAHMLAWVRSLSKEARNSISQDMRETIQWLTNIATLLQSEA